MKRLLLLLTLALCPFAHAQILDPILFGSAPQTGCGANYSTPFHITVDVHTIGLAGDITSWPILFTGNATLKTTGNGGQSLSTGTDVVFCSAAAGTGGTTLTYEFVPNSYSATAGTAEWWILAPTISHTTTTTIYGAVGKASASDLSCNNGNTASCAALYPNCISVQHMGYDNGSTSAQVLYDSCANVSGTNHSSTKFDNTTFPPVYEGAAFSSQYFDTGVTPGTNVVGSFSVEGWVANGSASTNLFWFGNDSSSTIGIPVYQQNSGGCMEPIVGVYTNSTNLIQETETGTCFGFTNAWHHLGAKHSAGVCGSTTCVSFWIDGVSKATTQVAVVGSPVDPGNSTDTWQIGRIGSGGAANWPGDLDEVRLFKAVLTGDQFLFDYTNQSNPTSTFSFAAP